MTKIIFVFSNGQKMAQFVFKGDNPEAEIQKIKSAFIHNDICLTYEDTKSKETFIINPRNILYVKIK